jgi:VWFA-related protein
MKFTAIFTAMALLMQAQQQSTVPDTGLKISVTTNLVIVDVDVRDKSGKPVEGLKAKDFSVYEDDKAQKLTVFEFQRLETDALPDETEPPKIKKPVAKAVEPAKPAAPKTAEVRRAITPSAAGQVRFKDRRLLVMFFDFSSMAQEDQFRAQASALKFLDSQITAADMVSIMTFSNKLQVVEDFTNDRERLRATIKGFHIGEGSDMAIDVATGDDTEGEDNGSAFTADETEFSVFNTDRKLSALESAAKMLGSMPEKKALVYFSSGVGKTGLENQSQLKATTNAAVKANVAFYPIDARGLVATAPAGNASSGTAKGSGMYSGGTQTSQRTKMNDQQETLVTLAGDTGGKALLDNNDLAMGIQQAQKDISSYYILGYYSTNGALDGKFRRLKVKLNDAKIQAKLNFRSGYFAGKDFKKFNSSEKERQLEEALLLGDPMTDLPLALEVNYFRMGKSTYFVPVALKIPGSTLETVKRGNSDQAEFDFIAQVRDSAGKLAGTVRDGIVVKIGGANAGKLTQRNLEYDSGFTLPPGKYTMKLLARENVSGRMGTFETKFTIPDLAAQSPWLQMSSVVWSNQREAMSAAVASAEKNKKLLASHPLIQDGQKLVPSITRVYRKNQNLYVYLEVYDPGLSESGKRPDVMASLSFYQGGVKSFQTAAVHVTNVAASRQHTVPVQFEMPLASLKPGKYTCQVNLVDEIGQKFAFSRAPMVLVK